MITTLIEATVITCYIIGCAFTGCAIYDELGDKLQGSMN